MQQLPTLHRLTNPGDKRFKVWFVLLSARHPHVCRLPLPSPSCMSLQPMKQTSFFFPLSVMFLYIRDVTVHGRYVLCLVGQAASLLVVVVGLVLLLEPEDLHDQALRLFLDLSHVRKLPSLGMEVFYDLFAVNRLGLRIFLGITVFLHAVCIFVFRALSDHLGVRAHVRAMYTVRFILWLQQLSLVLCLFTWIVLGNWSGLEMLPFLKKGWFKAMKLYLYDHHTQGVINDVQQQFQCCGYDKGYHTWQMVYGRSEPVPYSCCRVDSFLPCPVTNVSRFLQYDQGTRLLADTISQQECPDVLLRYLVQWPLAYLPLIFIVLSQSLVFSKLALSSKHNVTKNRDPLALTPATAFNWLGQPPVPKDQQT